MKLTLTLRKLGELDGHYHFFLAKKVFKILFTGRVTKVIG